MKFRRQIGSQIVVAECGDDLADQANALLDTLEQLHTRGPALRNGTSIEFGWSPLELRARDSELIVCEPDFAGDPFRDSRPKVDDTLRVLRDQVLVGKRIGVEPVAAYFSKKVIIAMDSVYAYRVYLERKSPAFEDDSGWYVGEVSPGQQAGSNEPKDYDQRYIYEFLVLRRELMPLFALPCGYLAIVAGETIQALFDSNGKDVWTAGV